MFGITGEQEGFEKSGNVPPIVPPITKRRVISDDKLKKVVITPSNTKFNAIDLATNVVELIKEDLDEFRHQVETLTKEYSDFLRTEILPHLIAFDAAVDYNRSLLSDGIGRKDVATDDSLSTSLKWLLHMKVINKFSEKLDIDLSATSKISDNIAELMRSDLSKSASYNSLSTLGRVVSKGSL